MMFSTSMNKVYSCGSVSTRSDISPVITSFTDRINRSHAPPICGEAGGLKSQVIFISAAARVILGLSRLDRNSFSSFTAPWKFVPQSEYTFSGQPRRFVNRLKALMKESVSEFSTTSR